MSCPIAQYVFRNQMVLWGEQMESLLSGALDAQSERGAAASLLDVLPDEFTTTDQQNFLAQKDLPNGKKTMKSYLWPLELAAYDAEHE